MQLTAEQHKKRIQMDQVIKFRNRDQPSSQKQQKAEEKPENSCVIMQDESTLKNMKKNLPLPELNQEKRKLKMYDPKPASAPAFLEKEVALRDNLILKNNNNALLTENKQMKTRITNLQRELRRFQKVPEGSQRVLESALVRTLIKNLKKELEESKKQVARLKTSTKFTSIKELQIEKQSIMEQTRRLRQMLQAQQQQTSLLRKNQNEHLQMEIKKLQQKCSQFERDEKLRKTRPSKSSFMRVPKTPLPYNDVLQQLEIARKIIKSKQEEIGFLKKEIKKMSNNLVIGDFSQKNMRIGEQKQKPQTPNLRINTKRQMKSAPKNRHNIFNDLQNCTSCKKLMEENENLKLQVEELKQELQKLRIERLSPIEDLISQPISSPTRQEAESLRKFVIYRLKAHGISLQEAVSYLLNGKNFSPPMMNETISLLQIFETASLEPFSLIIDRYIEVFLCTIFVGQKHLQGDSVKLEGGMKKTKQEVKDTFERFIGPFTLDSKEQEERLFIQVSQIVTSRAQEISKVLTLEKGAQDAISEEKFRATFQKLGVAGSLINFMISQIILQSLSLQFLKIDNLFEIFYLVQEDFPKEKVERREIAPIKEEQMEDEESRSFFEPKKQSQLNREERQFPEAIDSAKRSLPEQEYDADHFQEQRDMQQQPAREKQGDSSQNKEVQIESIDENYEDYFDS